MVEIIQWVEYRRVMVPLDIFVTYFSAYSAHAIEYKGTLYPTVEHAYHCQRYDQAIIQAEIRMARSPLEAWAISQKYKAQQLADFKERKSDIMLSLCQAKLDQHEDVRQALAKTGSVPIIKHITTGPAPDGYWDDGGGGEGRNEAGKIWMRLRSEMQSLDT